ncbi:hypothetical protein [Catenulispora rubra]|uniref:hypothetical protein n=1 Tax=Catenulispora rubra TaxID=280293 RepID=UPI00189230FD|nr:hypothetical protein [Catenulispora rubra]
MLPMIGAVCVALLVAGCSSSGTVGGSGSSNSSVGSLTGGASGGSDAGCTEALQAIQNAEKVANNTDDVQGAVKVATASIGQLRDAANITQKPGGKDAMNKVADDVQAVVTGVENGQKPSARQALTDAQVVVGLCGS